MRRQTIKNVGKLKNHRFFNRQICATAQIRGSLAACMISGLMVVLLVTGITTGVTAYAATSDTGATGASNDQDYTLEEMLVYAIEDEYLAQAEYDLIMDTYGNQKPFSNIMKAEATHISLLEPLLKENKVEMPVKDWASLVSVPEYIEAAYAIGVEAEEKNIAMYKSFLKENLPDDVREAFEKLMNASEKHLATFQRQVDGNRSGLSGCNGSGKNGQSRRNGNAVGGNGRGNRSTSRGSCILQ